MSSGKRTALLFGGIIVIIVFFFGGIFSIFWTDDMNVGSILFRVMVLPFVGFILGSAMIVYATGGITGGTQRRMGVSFFGAMQHRDEAREKTYVHDLPDRCPNCKGQISNETVDWVGPLTARCPYCGSSIKTEKREV